MGAWSFGGIEEFLTTRITKEHKDGHVFLVFVVCVCFVVEQGFELRREEGVSEVLSAFLPPGVGQTRGQGR